VSIAANFSGLWRNNSGAVRPGCDDLTPELVQLCSAKPPEDVSLYNIVYSVIDTETTGLRPDTGDEVISAACVRVVAARIQNDYFYTLVDPEREVPELATTITGITTERVRGQPVLEKVLPRLLQKMAGGLITGFNIQFDLVFLNNGLKRKCGAILKPAVVLDVLSLCRILKPRARTFGLGAMAREYQISVKDRHNALGDALITARLLLCLLPELEARGVRTLRDLRHFLRYHALY